MISIIKKHDFPDLTISYGKKATDVYSLPFSAKATALCGESDRVEWMLVQNGVLISALTLTAGDLEVQTLPSSPVRWKDLDEILWVSSPALQLWNRTSLGRVFIPLDHHYLSSSIILKWVSFPQVGIPLQLLSLAHGVNRQNGDPLAMLRQWVSL